MIETPRRPLLVATGLTKSYAGVEALCAASFDLEPGEVHALVGENGAGKSTLVKILTGAIQPDAGVLRVRGEVVTHRSPRAAKAHGIAAIYQQPALFGELSVAENIALAVEDGRPWRRVRWRERRQRAAELLARLGARIDPDARAGELSMPEQQLVEIARALGADASIVILDEPTASLTAEDTRRLFDAIRHLRAHGAGLIYISHRLDELPLIADRITILRDGRTIDTRRMTDVTRSELVRLMVGRQVTAAYRHRAAAKGETDPVLELHGVGCRRSGVRDVTLSVHAGEIVGLAGLVGAGRTELARTIFGIMPADEGAIRVRGVPVTVAAPRDAIRHGIAYLPEDRRQHGVVLDMAIAANMTLAALDRVSQRGTLNRHAETMLAADYTRRLGVRTGSLQTRVAALSGGNQQKVALARWLATTPSVLILDEPTQGVDIGAKAEIHELITRLASEGAAILLISSELPEVIGMSDRVAVMAGGTIVRVLERDQIAQESILEAALQRTTV